MKNPFFDIQLRSRFLVAAIVMAISIVAIACSSDDLGPDLKLGDTFTLSIGSFVEVDAGDENYRVDFMGIVADSRCAPGVTCITAGVAEILLGLTGEDGQRRTFPVNVPPEGSVISDLLGYRLTLARLLPDPPPVGVTSSLYRAELVLTRLP
jgi:hypothetical protein